MATESADGPELSVSLPPPLDEWVDERADSLGVDREELLVQVLGAYRAAADLEDDVGAGTDPGEASERVATEVEAQLDERDGDLSSVSGRIDALEEGLEEDLESLRNRVLQLRDAVRNRAKTDHTHEEFTHLSEDIDDVATNVADLSDTVRGLESDVADADAKLDTLARVVLQLRDRDDGRSGGSSRHLDQLRKGANRRGVTDASCADCGRSVSIPLLTEPACPHCGTELREITTTGILFTRATVTGPEAGPTDETEGESDE